MFNTDTISVPQELLALLSEIDEVKDAWRLLGTIAPERLNALRCVATIEHRNHRPYAIPRDKRPEMLCLLSPEMTGWQRKGIDSPYARL